MDIEKATPGESTDSLKVHISQYAAALVSMCKFNGKCATEIL